MRMAHPHWKVVVFLLILAVFILARELKNLLLS